jgi:ankyrin repeat protein
MAEDNQDADKALIAAVIADNAPLVQELLEKGAKANCCEDSAELRPLHFAAIYNSPSVIPLLVMGGADSAALTDCDDTPLSIAERHGHEKVITILSRLIAHGVVSRQ